MLELATPFAFERCLGFGVIRFWIGAWTLGVECGATGEIAGSETEFSDGLGGLVEAWEPRWNGDFFGP